MEFGFHQVQNNPDAQSRPLTRDLTNVNEIPLFFTSSFQLQSGYLKGAGWIRGNCTGTIQNAEYVAGSEANDFIRRAAQPLKANRSPRRS
jgi:hypothetical protein